MRFPKLTVRDTCWLVVVVALALAVMVDRRRHADEVERLQHEARVAIHGLSYEVFRCNGRPAPASRFAPKTPIPPQYDWKLDGSLVPEWAEERLPNFTPRRTR